MGCKNEDNNRMERQGNHGYRTKHLLGNVTRKMQIYTCSGDSLRFVFLQIISQSPFSCS